MRSRRNISIETCAFIFINKHKMQTKMPYGVPVAFFFFVIVIALEVDNIIVNSCIGFMLAFHLLSSMFIAYYPGCISCCSILSACYGVKHEYNSQLNVCKYNASAFVIDFYSMLFA